MRFFFYGNTFDDVMKLEYLKILELDFEVKLVKKSFWSELKTIFQVFQVLSFRLKNQTSKNVADAFF